MRLLNYVITPRWNIVMSVSVCQLVCLCVCPPVHRPILNFVIYMTDLYQFYTCYLWPWLGAALRYVMYFRFMDGVIFNCT